MFLTSICPSDFIGRFKLCVGVAPACLALISASTAYGATGIAAIDQNPNLSVSADLRVRYEADWDSQTAAGVPRNDRQRGRVRARLGAGYKLSSDWSVGTRLRTGNRESQQSPHLTFSSNDGPSDDFEVSFDRYFIQYKKDAVTAWAGRNTSPFWHQNELFWDEDVTPTGVAGSIDSKQGSGTLTATAGAFALPDGAVELNGQLFAGQVKYTVPLKPSQFTVAAGLHSFEGEKGARYLRNRNGERDYLVGIVSAQWTIPLDGVPFALGIDLIENLESYSAADVAPWAPLHANETSGYVLSAQYGQLKQAKDWLVGHLSRAHRKSRRQRLLRAGRLGAFRECLTVRPDRHRRTGIPRRVCVF